MKLEIQFVDATDKVWEHFIFKQEGMLGMRLPGAYLPEFIEALELDPSADKVCFYLNYFVLNTRKGTIVTISTRTTPLLQLSASQRAKLIAHLRSTYTSLISIYR